VAAFDLFVLYLCALQIIDPSLNSVSFSFVLVATIAAFRKDADTISNELLWQNITSFLERFDPKQTRYIGPELSLVIESAAEIAVMLQAVSTSTNCQTS
jgi:hypothetical protein